MANKFDAFDNAPVVEEPRPPQTMIQPGQSPLEAAATMTPEAEPGAPPNAFDDPAAAMAAQTPPSEMSEDQWEKEFATRLAARDPKNPKMALHTPEGLIAWSKETPYKITGNEKFYNVIRNRDADLRKDKPRGGGYYSNIDHRMEEGFNAAENFGAAARQGGNSALFNYGDEALSALKSIPEALTTGTLPWNTDTYEESQADFASINDVDWAANKVGSWTGLAAGTLMGAKAIPSFLSAPKVVTAGRTAVPAAEVAARVAPQAATRAQKAGAVAKGLAVRGAVGAGEGAAYGAAAATGEGYTDAEGNFDRFGNTGSGALLGTAFGGGLPVAAEVLGRVARPIAERIMPRADGPLGDYLGEDNAFKYLQSSERALAERLGLSPDDFAGLKAEMQRQRDLGLEPALMDVLPEKGRNVIGTAGSYDDARQVLQDEASARTVQLPERVQGAADDMIAPTDRVPTTRYESVERPVSQESIDVAEQRLDDLYEMRQDTNMRDDELDEMLESFPTDMLRRTFQGSFVEPGMKDLLEQYAVRRGFDIRAPAGSTATSTRPVQEVTERTMSNATQARGELSEFRKADVEARMAPIRENPLPLDNEVADILSSNVGKRYLQEAIDIEPDPVMREQMTKLLEGIEGLKNIPANIGPAARAQMTQQIMGGAIYNVNVADKVSRELIKEGRKGKPALEELGKTIRNHARTKDKAYDNTLKAYSTQKTSEGAVDTGEDFLKADPDEFVDAVGATRQTSTSKVSREIDGKLDLEPKSPTYNSGSNGTSYKATYTGGDGRPVEATVVISEDGTKAYVATIEKIHQWGSEKGSYGNMAVKNMMQLIKQKFPKVKEFGGSRVTGAHAANEDVLGSAKQTVRAPAGAPGRSAMSDRDYVATGAASSVKARAGEGPSEAKGVAEKLYDSPNQRRRTEAVIGPERAGKLADRMREEVQRVYRANRQATKEGPAKETGIMPENALHNITTPTGQAFMLRDAIRLLHKVGMSERDANWIVKAAIDPKRTDEIVARLEKAGMNQLQARAQAAQLTAAVVRGAASSEEN